MNIVMIAALAPLLLLGAGSPPPISAISQVGGISETRVLSAEEAWAYRKKEWSDAMAAIPPETTSIQSLADACVPHHFENCRTQQGGYFNARGRRLYWQLQEGDPDDNAGSAGFVFFTESSGVLTPVFWAFEAHDYERPVLMWVGDKREPVIAIGGTMAGNGHYNADVILRWNSGEQTLVPIDNQNWGLHLRDHLPEGLDIRKGLFFNYWPSGRVTAEAGLWRPDDGECCPQGGTAKLYFDIEGDALVLKDVEIQQPPGP
jgi:hypothetical protein